MFVYNVVLYWIKLINFCSCFSPSCLTHHISVCLLAVCILAFAVLRTVFVLVINQFKVTITTTAVHCRTLLFEIFPWPDKMNVHVLVLVLVVGAALQTADGLGVRKRLGINFFQFRIGVYIVHSNHLSTTYLWNYFSTAKTL